MSTEIAKPPEKPATLQEMLKLPGVKAQLSQALPSHCKPDRFLRVVANCIRRVPKLAECDQGSFFNCLLTLSQYGLEPDGRNAHLIPFRNNKAGITECQLIIDYKGLVELAMRSGLISTIHADVVCELDDFSYNMGEIERHRIDLRKDRGEVYAVYAIVKYRDGSRKCEVMTRTDVEAIRKRSKSGNNGPWVTDWNEMAKKTVFKRLSKWISISAEFRDAVESDEDRIDPAGVVLEVDQRSKTERLTDRLLGADVEIVATEAEATAEPGLSGSPNTLAAFRTRLAGLGANLDAKIELCDEARRVLPKDEYEVLVAEARG